MVFTLCPVPNQYQIVSETINHLALSIRSYQSSNLINHLALVQLPNASTSPTTPMFSVLYGTAPQLVCCSTLVTHEMMSGVPQCHLKINFFLILLAIFSLQACHRNLKRICVQQVKQFAERCPTVLQLRHPYLCLQPLSAVVPALLQTHQKQLGKRLKLPF